MVVLIFFYSRWDNDVFVKNQMREKQKKSLLFSIFEWKKFKKKKNENLFSREFCWKFWNIFVNFGLCGIILSYKHFNSYVFGFVAGSSMCYRLMIFA